MQERYIYLIRHGKPSLPDDNKRYIGQLDLPLSESGITGAALLALRLQTINFAALYSSDLQRSLDTAEIQGSRLGLPTRAVGALREINLGCMNIIKHVKCHKKNKFSVEAMNIS